MKIEFLEPMSEAEMARYCRLRGLTVYAYFGGQRMLCKGSDAMMLLFKPVGGRAGEIGATSVEKEYVGCASVDLIDCRSIIAILTEDEVIGAVKNTLPNDVDEKTTKRLAAGLSEEQTKEEREEVMVDRDARLIDCIARTCVSIITRFEFDFETDLNFVRTIITIMNDKDVIDAAKRLCMDDFSERFENSVIKREATRYAESHSIKPRQTPWPSYLVSAIATELVTMLHTGQLVETPPVVKKVESEVRNPYEPVRIEFRHPMTMREMYWYCMARHIGQLAMAGGRRLTIENEAVWLVFDQSMGWFTACEIIDDVPHGTITSMLAQDSIIDPVELTNKYGTVSPQLHAPTVIVPFAKKSDATDIKSTNGPDVDVLW